MLFPALGTAIFGVCPFGLRNFSVLFTAALVAVCYLLGKNLFKSGGFGFLFACFAALGGLAFTVGRLGVAYSLIALLLAASLYFMFRYFEGGNWGERPLKTASNVLFSGLLFALAVAADPKCLIALIAPVALFIAGWVRQRRDQKQEISVLRTQLLERNASENSEEAMQENVDAFNAAERRRRPRTAMPTAWCGCSSSFPSSLPPCCLSSSPRSPLTLPISSCTRRIPRPLRLDCSG